MPCGLEQYKRELWETPGPSGFPHFLSPVTKRYAPDEIAIPTGRVQKASAEFLMQDGKLMWIWYGHIRYRPEWTWENTELRSFLPITDSSVT